MKNIYNICTGFFAKTVVMIVLLIAGGVNVVWGEVKYVKCTSISDLHVGDVYFISGSKSYSLFSSVMGMSTGGNNFPATNFNVHPLELTLGGDIDNGWTFSYIDGDMVYYLDPTSTTSYNYLKRNTEKTAYCKFAISFNDDSSVLIVSRGKSSHNIISKYNSLYSCYSKVQESVYLYKYATLSYSLNGAEIGQQIARVTSFPCALPSTASYSREGYIANGWNTKADGSGVHYDEGYSFDAPDEDVTLFVEWRKVDVDDDALCVKFNAGENGTYNGGDVAETVAGDGIVLPDVAAKDGWTFIGWATTENSAIADAGKAGVVYHPSSDGQVLYAVYEMASVTHTVKFFVNGEQVGDTQELHAGDGVVFPNKIPADINGKKFVGWMKGEISRSQDDVPVLLENAKMENSDIVFNAVFAKLSVDDGSHALLSDNFKDSSSDDDHAFESDNFTGYNYKAFTSKFGGVKLGTAQYNGYITTKPLNLSQSFTVSVKVKGYGNSGGTLQVSVDNNKQSKTYNFSATSEQDYETAVFTFEAATTTSTIKIGTPTSSKRAYIDDVVVTTAGAVYSGYCTSLLTVKKAVSVVTSENRKIDEKYIFYPFNRRNINRTG